MITWTKKLQKFGGSICVVIPKAIADKLKLQLSDLITIGVKTGKFGDYVAIWKEKKIKVE